jgi:hypothetical protein
MKRFVSMLAFSLIAFSANALTLSDYIGALERIESLVDSGQYDSASNLARSLSGQTIESPNGRFHADDALLGSLFDPKKIEVRVVPRIAATVSELRRVNGDKNPVRSDQILLDTIEKEQRVAKPKEGGEISTDELTGDWTSRMTKAMGDVFEWIGDKIEKFMDWLSSFWPKSRQRDVETTGDIRGLVIGIAIAIAIFIVALAWIAIRRGRRAAPEVVESAAPIASKADEDPLSRASNEWERYAAQLASARRYREAIRAWYHAVLVALYSAAILHHRKGRTNWEYIATLSPSLPWRREFIELTRRFEHEWYGAFESDEQAHDDCSRRAKSILSAIVRVSRGAA